MLIYLYIGNGYRIPAEAHLQKNLTLEKQISKIKMVESIRGEKEVQENLTFAYDSVETENKNKEVEDRKQTAYIKLKSI